MIGFMYRMARNTAAAEDLAQEVFCGCTARGRITRLRKFTTWLYRIATNLG
jgi:DNA-directed RNA polymerase specialized sigma24 family protein